VKTLSILVAMHRAQSLQLIFAIFFLTCFTFKTTFYLNFNQNFNFWVVIRALQSNKDMYYPPPPPACSSLHITEASPGTHLAGPVHENGQPLTKQSVHIKMLYHKSALYRKLPPPTSPRELHVCYQPGQAEWSVRSNVQSGHFR
jgi:hypothetical protein